MDNNDKKIFTLGELIGREYFDFELRLRPTEPTAFGDTASIVLEKNGYTKYINYTASYGHFSRPMTNLVDGCYGNNTINYGDGSFIWSCEVEGKIRAFVGLNNVYFGIVYPIGFDLNTRKFIIFPINKLGLIDEKIMKKLLKNQDLMNQTIGFDIDNYQEIMKTADLYRITNLLYNKESFNIETDVCEWILDNLEEYNQDKIIEVKQMFEDKDRIR